jgi:hypothetical protein
VTVSDHRQALEDLRDQLTTAVSMADPKELPPLSRELRQVWAELTGLPDGKKQAVPDRIAQQREERRRKAAGG